MGARNIKIDSFYKKVIYNAKNSYRTRLNDWEKSFIDSIFGNEYMSDNERKKLNEISNKVIW